MLDSIKGAFDIAVDVHTDRLAETQQEEKETKENRELSDQEVEDMKSELKETWKYYKKDLDSRVDALDKLKR